MRLLEDLLPLIAIVGFSLFVVLALYFYGLWSARRGDTCARSKAREWPAHAPPLREVAQSIIAKSALPACLLQPRRELPIISPVTTILGDVRCGLPGEAWPTYGGAPMVGLCQLNLKESLFVPKILADLAFITVFMARGKESDWPIDYPFEGDKDREKWVVRAYGSLEGLVPYVKAPSPVFHPCAVEQSALQDPAPNHSGVVLRATLEQLGLDGAYVERIEEEIYDIEEEQGEIRWGSKIGGWPAPIQSDIERPLAFQLGSEGATGIHWIDAGCAYFWRSKLDDGNDRWSLEIEFY